MANNQELLIFAGPTLAGLTDQDYGTAPITFHPPARRGDVDTVIKASKPGALAIVDGTFHTYPAVGHAEILRAIQLGWKVWGLSSLGAILAAEMQSLGMLGFGQVFKQFVENGLTDDEVTLVHQDGPPYLALSEPLIHIRIFLANLEMDGLINRDTKESLLRELQSEWYGLRTLPLLKERLIESGLTPTKCEQAFSDFDNCRIKQQDLKLFLGSAPWVEGRV